MELNARSCAAASRFSQRRTARRAAGWPSSENPDVILLELEMPDDDRWEAVRRLKNDPQTRDIPIIGMSAHAVESEREKAIATGCDEFDA